MESRGIKIVEARGNFFQLVDWRNFWLEQTVRMKTSSFDVCQKTLQIYGKWKTRNCAQMWEQRSSTTFHLEYFVLKKHLLHKEKIVSLSTTYIDFKGKSLFLRLLKVELFDRQHFLTAPNRPTISASDRRIRILLEPLSLWWLSGAAMETMPLGGR